MKKTVALFLIYFLAYEIKGDEMFYYSNNAFKEIPVFYTGPERVDKNTRLVVVMHGRKRNAEEYRNQWKEAAKDLNLLVIVPEFSEKNFPQVWGFNYGNIKTANLEPIQENLQAFSVIEPLRSMFERHHQLLDFLYRNERLQTWLKMHHRQYPWNI